MKWEIKLYFLGSMVMKCKTQGKPLQKKTITRNFYLGASKVQMLLLASRVQAYQSKQNCQGDRLERLKSTQNLETKSFVWIDRLENVH